MALYTTITKKYSCFSPFSKYKNKIEYIEWEKHMLDNIAPLILSLSNKDLLEEYSFISAGDDHDGAFTDLGVVYFHAVEEILHQRLVEIGFLEKE